MFWIGLTVLIVGTLADAYTTYRALRWGGREVNPLSKAVFAWAKRRGRSLKTAVFLGAIVVDAILVTPFLVVTFVKGSGSVAGTVALIFGVPQLVVAYKNSETAKKLRERWRARQ